ncbi:lysophospholipid acyltransferase family protein [Helicobacter kayseriensis]|uniref:lysophospholipid acyltransferase family protein n=1 Tax=Helicobacter kayseriensis TaxID=2905877 RepID=UPI001E313F4B|nr:lysophospholipid acyltransferase family protein [Helicobacter kayseriensis]MCE3047234.1 lysophospholipid acyltransferase family protein [Helicobacter kayseriensis]MCE3048605.1 lysophospholipid acyltransferase family protein [Helicobacter kayseriensis]
MIKHLKKKLLFLLAPRVLYAFLWLVYKTSKHRFHIPQESIQDSFIATFWHGEIPMQGFFYHHILKKLNHRDLKHFRYGVLISEHSDGEIATRLYEMYGFTSIRGSSTRGGAKALIDALNKLKNGWNIGLTPDGPKGPYHSVAKGAVIMALKSQKKIIGLRVEPKKFWQLKSWDKMKLPKPFGVIDYYVLPPLWLDSNLSIEENQAILKTYLEQDLL